MALGKICKYCAKCELIIAHQHELEAELAHAFSTINQSVIGNEYLVIGTIDKKLWEEGVKGKSPELKDTRNVLSDFKKVYDFKVESGGWYRKKD